ncbi:hypothetical protein BTO30_16115 [Domibacillus antri]|uniref:Uncharacterized protein n=1 Tax=Domibacillus antri TaxID=1714264 RepID=A0A1Q8Q1J1_9BACI|nr:hypothetical protein [Domibacillus antri]OLN21204.1 hypothetical protein BTO30_16115 [Domibacillus antri]
MSRALEQDSDVKIAEMVEDVSFDDIDNDNCEWLQKPPVHLKEYGFDEVDREEEYYFVREILSDYLTER